ncbi:MAG: hypothetical protein IPP13_28060 [Kouleothrix sp.]|nr:hypothetical protein [Kouleothrix sp.]
MDGISLAELRQRHAECMEARATLQRLFHDQDTGFAYVLGELEQMIKQVEGDSRSATCKPRAAWRHHRLPGTLTRYVGANVFSSGRRRERVLCLSRPEQ